MAAQFTPMQIQEFKQKFQAIDADGNGFIDLAELDAAMKQLGHNHSVEELQQWLNGVDADGDGKINFDEYLAVLGPKSEEYDAAIIAVFKEFDKDGSGKISHAELKAALSKIGGAASDELITAMIQLADENGDGSIDYNEFLKIMKNPKN